MRSIFCIVIAANKIKYQVQLSQDKHLLINSFYQGFVRNSTTKLLQKMLGLCCVTGLPSSHRSDFRFNAFTPPCFRYLIDSSPQNFKLFNCIWTFRRMDHKSIITRSSLNYISFFLLNIFRFQDNYPNLKFQLNDDFLKKFNLIFISNKTNSK